MTTDSGYPSAGEHQSSSAALPSEGPQQNRTAACGTRIQEPPDFAGRDRAIQQSAEVLDVHSTASEQDLHRGGDHSSGSEVSLHSHSVAVRGTSALLSLGSAAKEVDSYLSKTNLSGEEGEDAPPGGSCTSGIIFRSSLLGVSTSNTIIGFTR